MLVWPPAAPGVCDQEQCSVVAFTATPPVLPILKSETTTHPEQRLFQVRELLNTFPNDFWALQGELWFINRRKEKDEKRIYDWYEIAACWLFPKSISAALQYLRCANGRSLWVIWPSAFSSSPFISLLGFSFSSCQSPAEKASFERE